MKTENNFFKKKEVTVHVFDTVYKPKITVHGQWTLPNACRGKKKKKNAENAT